MTAGTLIEPVFFFPIFPQSRSPVGEHISISGIGGICDHLICSVPISAFHECFKQIGCTEDSCIQMIFALIRNVSCQISEDLLFFLILHSSQFPGKGLRSLCPDTIPADLLMEKFPTEGLYGIFLQDSVRLPFLLFFQHPGNVLHQRSTITVKIGIDKPGRNQNLRCRPLSQTILIFPFCFYDTVSDTCCQELHPVFHISEMLLQYLRIPIVLVA